MSLWRRGYSTCPICHEQGPYWWVKRLKQGERKVAPNHPKCCKCGVLVGDGHIEQDPTVIDGELWCSDCLVYHYHPREQADPPPNNLLFFDASARLAKAVIGDATKNGYMEPQIPEWLRSDDFISVWCPAADVHPDFVRAEIKNRREA